MADTTAGAEEEDDEEDEEEDMQQDIEEAEVPIGQPATETAKESEEEEIDGGMTVQLAASEDEDEEDEEILATMAADDDWDGFSGNEDVEDGNKDDRNHQLELEAESLGRRVDASDTAAEKRQRVKDAVKSQKSRAEREAAEEVERRKMMMPARKRKMYEKMVYSNTKKDDEVEKLKAKRRKIEKQLGKKK